ncbi:MAG: UDP-N-acetylglucosamine 1-carboxyvinyltransferase [Cytophagales bacterium]|nr:UDP-N-acetylglucosamine 1-carboxyvinyltransferase [Armatimonadota bacterium]
MEHFVIEGGRKLAGTITPVGNKNAALPLLAASLLTRDPLTLQNVPNIGDVRTKVELLRRLGVSADFAADTGVCTLISGDLEGAEPDLEISRRIRTAPLLAGPLLARRGYATIGMPGGDRIGRRRLDTHLLALQSLGATIEPGPGQFTLRADRGLRGADIFLDEMSVTGTEQALLAAVTAEGTTTIANAASEPHVQDVCRCLTAMGAKIAGIGTNHLVVEGVTSLRGTTYAIGPDYMEVGSLIGLAAATGSALRIENARPDEQRMAAIMLGRLGVRWDVDGETILVPPEQELVVHTEFDGAIPKIDDMPWPGFPPDLVSIALVVATQARGTVLIHQKMFDRRLVFTDSLVEMGAQIVLCDPHRAVVIGPTPLHGRTLVSPDIRAGMALVIAALAAQGQSRIHNIQQIDRGYAELEVRLRSLGAIIERRGGGA